MTDRPASNGPERSGVGQPESALAHDLERAEALVPAWLRPAVGENRVPAALAILAGVVLQLTLPDRYGLRPRAVLPVLELLLLVVLTVLNPVRLSRRSALGRGAPVPGLPVPADDQPGHRRARLGATLPGLPVRLADQCHRLLPDRHVPLTRSAKSLMAVQSLVALSIVDWSSPARSNVLK